MSYDRGDNEVQRWLSRRSWLELTKDELKYEIEIREMSPDLYPLSVSFVPGRPKMGGLYLHCWRLARPERDQGALAYQVEG